MTSAFKELGVTGMHQFGGVTYIEPDSRLQGLLGIRTYEEIRKTDPTGAAMYMVLTLPLRKVQWRCEPAGDSPVDEEAAEFTWSALNDMSITFADFLSDACLMFEQGWSYFDMSMKRRQGEAGAPKSRFDDGRVGFKKLKLIPHRAKVRWEFEENGDIKGLWVLSKDNTQQLLPLERSLLFRTSREGDNPEGLSIFRPAVRPYRYKRRLEQIEGTGLHRRWAGFPTVILPAGATSKLDQGTNSDEARAEQIVQAIYEDRMMGAYLPEGWELSFGGPEGNVDRTMGETILRKDAEMARAILAQFLLLGLRDVGTQALAETLLESFYDAIEAFLGMIRDALNRYAIPYLFRFNEFEGLSGLPELQFSNPRHLDLGALASYLGTIMGSLTLDTRTEAFLRSVIPGMPEPPADAEQAPEPEQGTEEESEPEPDPEGEEEEETERATRRRGRELFATTRPAPTRRPTEYHALANNNAAAQRSYIESWTDEMAQDIAGLSRDASEAQLREKLDDYVMVALSMFHERSMLDIAEAFWLGFGKPSGGPEQLLTLQQEVALADSWMGYGAGGELVQTNPAGKPTLFGDIAGTLEGRIAAILLLLKDGRRDEVPLEIANAVKSATQNYHRTELYAGHVWRGIWSGAYQRRVYEGVDGPVRWVLDPVAKHCPTCLDLGNDPPGRQYPSMSALISVSGGILPGYGTECDGRCRCHLEELREGVWVWL